jgi:hypothetical protein
MYLSSLLERDYAAFELKLEGKMVEATYFVINDWGSPLCNETYSCQGKVKQETPTHLAISCPEKVVVVRKTAIIELIVHKDIEREAQGVEESVP